MLNSWQALTHRQALLDAAIDRAAFRRTAGHPPPGVPLTSGYNPDATVTKEVPGFGGDKRVNK